MKKILVTGGSHSKTSINKTLALYASSLMDGTTILSPDLNDYEMPIYSPEFKE
ncbi:MAG: hypothetical protein AAGA18_05200 [Verrucomicrobiota bacterium]